MDEKTLLDKIKDMLKDECDGVKTYAELADVMEKMYPDKDYARDLRKIAIDEYTHKYYIMRLLDDMHAFVPSDVKTMWDEAEECYKSMRSGG